LFIGIGHIRYSFFGTNSSALSVYSLSIRVSFYLLSKGRKPDNPDIGISLLSAIRLTLEEHMSRQAIAVFIENKMHTSICPV
jgi:hypothetical protein